MSGPANVNNFSLHSPNEDLRRIATEANTQERIQNLSRDLENDIRRASGSMAAGFGIGLFTTIISMSKLNIPAFLLFAGTSVASFVGSYGNYVNVQKNEGILHSLKTPEFIQFANKNGVVLSRDTVQTTHDIYQKLLKDFLLQRQFSL
ncbi:MAG: hypothetical protein JSS32_09210 [Verrucomicrobia bacterium]|nr:hypothetical protein [Verrucomicrobiota bacterium]